MRLFVVCFLTFLGSAQLVQGAAISVTLNGNRAGAVLAKRLQDMSHLLLVNRVPEASDPPWGPLEP